jgi:hypothetical protein
VAFIASGIYYSASGPDFGNTMSRAVQLPGEPDMNLHRVRKIAARLVLPAAMLLIPAPGIAGSTSAFLPSGVVLYQGIGEPPDYAPTAGALIPLPSPQPGLGSTCPDQSYLFINFNGTDSNGYAMYSSVLAAMLAGHKVSFATYGCDTTTGVYPAVYAVTIF